MTKYLYFIDKKSDDFFTTSFNHYTLPVYHDAIHDGQMYNEETGQDIEIIDVFNFDHKIDNVEYVAIGDTLGLSKAWFANKSKMKVNVFRIRIIESDAERMTLRLEILDEMDNFDYQSYKREIKIDILLK